MPKCKICKTEFTKTRPLQSICNNFDCVLAYAEKSKVKRIEKEAKAERKSDKEKKDSIKKKPELRKEAQDVFNAYIRLRDYGKPCICCDKPIFWDGLDSTGGVCDAGHYMSRGAHIQHAFNEDNVHAQRKYCNSPRGLGGNYANYRIGLIKRIGIERVESLENDHILHHYSKDDLRDIKRKYLAKIKELQSQSTFKAL